MAKELTNSNLSDVMSANRLVMVDFWAEWCVPCRKVAPIVDELAEECAGTVDIYKCDVEDNPEICGEFGVKSIPTLIFIKEGKVLEKYVGTATKNHLMELIEKHK